MNGFTVPTTCPGRKQAKSSTLKIGSVTVVTSEQLIPPISGQSHRDMLTSQAADVIRRDNRGIAKRFFQRMRQLVYGFLDVRLDNQFMMLGAEPSRDQAGIFGFVEVLAGEANRECFDWARAGASHECNHSGGVNPSAQQCSERDIAEQPDPDCLSKAMLQFFQTFVLGKLRRPGQQRLDFGTKQESSVTQRVMQRLLSEAVSCQQQTFFAFVPE